jgi:hypothetical protein
MTPLAFQDIVDRLAHLPFPDHLDGVVGIATDDVYVSGKSWWAARSGQAIELADLCTWRGASARAFCARSFGLKNRTTGAQQCQFVRSLLRECSQINLRGHGRPRFRRAMERARSILTR